MWLSLRTSNPKCSIEKFYLPSLNKTLNQTTDSTLNLTLKLDNPNKDKGIKYDAVNVTVFDSPNRTHVIGNVLVPAFYQGHKKKAKKDGIGTANSTVALRAVSDNGTGVFRVDMSTAVKFKIMFWYTKKHRISVGADVMVNASGSITVTKKGIRLKSMAPRMGGFCLLIEALVNLLVFSLLNFWIPTVYGNSNGLHLHQKSGLPENARLSCRTSSGSLDTMTETGAALAELH